MNGLNVLKVVAALSESLSQHKNSLR